MKALPEWTTDLDVAEPEQVAHVLRYAADQYRQTTSELQSAWQDRGIVVWDKIAAILERAAVSCEKACAKYV